MKEEEHLRCPVCSKMSRVDEFDSGPYETERARKRWGIRAPGGRGTFFREWEWLETDGKGKAALTLAMLHFLRRAQRRLEEVLERQGKQDG